MKTRVMYMECKATGQATIGRVSFSKTGSTLRYRSFEFISLKGNGFKANYLETGSGEQYWIPGVSRSPGDVGGSVFAQFEMRSRKT
jgi:hypothetical protein